MNGLKEAEHKQYIDSYKWRKRRAQFYDEYGKFCRVCGDVDSVHLHHITYENIGNEPDEDLIPLCELHHMYAHGLQRKWGLELKFATSFLSEGSRYYG